MMGNFLTTLEAAPVPGDRSLQMMLLALLLSFVLGQAVAWVYTRTHSGLSYSRAFTQSLVVMTLVVTLVMFVIGDSIVTAFGLLGALALIRFRNVLKDTRDTVFVFISLVIGMAVGTQRYLLAIVGSIVLMLVIGFMEMTAFGASERFDGYLTLRTTKRNSEESERLLRRYCREVRLISSRRTAQAAEEEIVLGVGLRDRSRSDEFLEALREIEGVTHASIMVRTGYAEV